MNLKSFVVLIYMNIVLLFFLIYLIFLFPNFIKVRSGTLSTDSRFKVCLVGVVEYM